ncbi:MAG: transcriptional regulator [Bacteroidales bacterium]|nr:transcriptional regulator [Bacteroidales bacterium]
MAMNEYVMVAPQVTHLSDWVKGQIIDIEENPFRGIVITVRLDMVIFFGMLNQVLKK